MCGGVGFEGGDILQGPEVEDGSLTGDILWLAAALIF